MYYMLKRKEVIMNIALYKLIKLSDGYVFYEQKDGRYTDTKDGKNVDLSWNSWKDIREAIDIDNIEITTCELYTK